MQTQLMQMIMTMAVIGPVQKLAEKRCKEFAKELEKKAKTKQAKDINEVFVKTMLCGKAAELGKDAMKLAANEGKRALKDEQKKLDKQIAKERDPSSPKALELHNLRGTADTQIKRQLTFEDKPVELPKPKGDFIHTQVSLKVVSKDKVELKVQVWLGIDPKALTKPKDTEKRHVRPFYGLIGLSGRF